MNTPRPEASSRVVNAIPVVLHACLWLALLVGVFFIVPTCQRTFLDYKLRLPSLTEGLFATLRIVLGPFFFNPFVLSVPLGIDVMAIVMLRQSPQTKSKQRLWFWLMLVLPTVLILVVALALLFPLITIWELG